MEDRHDIPLRSVGWLYVATGAMMLLAPFFAFQGAGGLVGAGLPLSLGAVVLAAGVGLLRRAEAVGPARPLA